jgi:hypothetical protein
MALKLSILGVHPVKAEEPCHLIEIAVEGPTETLDFGQITQEQEGQPSMNWQVPYDEQIIEESDGIVRYAFFFHYLNLAKPLQTPCGPIMLPKPTKIPKHLNGIEYEAP